MALGLAAALPAGGLELRVSGYGRGERRRATLRHLNVPVPLPLGIVVTGTERWVRSSTA
jgi:hypothetical protein